jgi:small subunit ribosomal protein S16
VLDVNLSDPEGKKQMALRIRLKRMGRKKAPHYRIVIAESTMPRDGRFVATIGHYNPTTQPATLKVDRDKALAWIAKGAVATDTVHSLLRRAGVFKPAPTAAEGVVAAVTETAGKAAKAVKEAASSVVDAVKDAAGTVAEKVSDAAGAVAEKVSDAAEAVTDAVKGE